MTINPVKSIRSRYIIALSALALAITAMYLVVQNTITHQKNYGRVIYMASNQVGLDNRIALFASQMALSTSEDDFETARHQLTRAIRKMQRHHKVLLKGDPHQNIPVIMTPMLENLYFGSVLSLNVSFQRFIKQAEIVSEANLGELTPEMAAYVYVITYGPYVLEPLLNAAVSEYETFSRTEIQKLQKLELMVLIIAILLLLIEAVFIFRPLEKTIRTAFDSLRDSRTELEGQKKRAEHANQLKTNLLENMSHELRTPLNAIIGFSECLKTGIYGPLASEKQTESVEGIHGSGLHLLDLVDDILDISAAEAGTIELTETTEPIADLIATSVRSLGPIPKRKGVSMLFCRNGPDFSLTADERRIRQVLINLLMNAVKFTPQGGNVQISTLVHDDGRAGFTVSDTGVGMTWEEIEIAKERFGQAGNVMTRSHDGTGLGLPLSIKLLEYHSGTISIESEKGVGTTVTVLFPEHRIGGVKSRHSVAA